jgi:MFS superfamily sulfate permease-like transporter
VGHIDGGLPSLGLPDVRAKQYLELAGSAVGIVLIGFAEGLGAAKTYAARHHYEIDANSELLGMGAANLGAGLSSGMVVNGSLSKTAVNAGAGAKSQVSGLVVAALTIVTLLFLTGLFEKLPEATLAAVVIAAVLELVDIATLRRLARVVVRGQSPASGRGPISSRPSPRCSGFSSSTRSRPRHRYRLLARPARVSRVEAAGERARQVAGRSAPVDRPGP